MAVNVGRSFLTLRGQEKHDLHLLICMCGHDIARFINFSYGRTSFVLELDQYHLISIKPNGKLGHLII